MGLCIVFRVVPTGLFMTLQNLCDEALLMTKIINGF